MAKWFRRTEKKEFSKANPFLAMLYYNKAFKAWKWKWQNSERKMTEWKYEVHIESSDEEQEDQEFPEIYEEVIYEELNPEKEMEMKRQMILQGVKEKPLKIEWSDGWEKLNVEIYSEEDADDLLMLWNQTSENIMITPINTSNVFDYSP